ncbi:MAG: aminotransferase class V-fold PLP-dependent enzyme [Clostridiales bacterium]|jgi:cysteine desulfurase family protein|nr:aminotransferase class V-fold PLP-dependent enzyme [Clostridiales bacterium]MCI1960895.1 aminotransferase class V-fold PLP-dependent enzyme [Clostridiales bacterium]MCI2021336.1 aminotransferase class V-fold PLP-dependent enzyme [Clostridiales bacterium]MCI2025719.1 aminotransferase class V-fold PLP-dependent enzyme [Clostridiales bacterium]
MIYLDNAATTFPKPTEVWKAMQLALVRYGANPGRSGHSMSLRAAEEVYHCREAAAKLFDAEGPENVAFTMNCTQSLNFAIKGLVKIGGHVVTSNLEHNAVMRPLEALQKEGIITYTQAKVVPEDHDATLENFREALRENTCLVVCTQASNVWGIRVPVERICAMVNQYQIPMVVDCAQTAGVVPISMKDGYACICMAGHKGLYGPMGTGIMVMRSGLSMKTLIEGGTGTDSMNLSQPETIPDRFESGTVNLPGIAGLHQGILFVQKRTPPKIADYEMKLSQMFYAGLSHMKNVKLYTPMPSLPDYVPVISFNIEGMESEVAGEKLNREGIAVRAGLHCAPCAHQAFGTLESGAVRVCPSAFTTEKEIQMALKAVKKISAS